MIAFAYYLLKVTVCSGLLLLYYYAALRNKAFHQWNRFYLLATVLLSLLLPLSLFSFSSAVGTEKVSMAYLVQSADHYIDTITTGIDQTSAISGPVVAGYCLVGAALFISFFLAIIKIKRIAAAHAVQSIENIKFINTREPGTPFSFLNTLFWNDKIDLHSPSGQHIFGHELVHIKDKHTLDKLWLQAVLIACWANPFFWIIRKELSVIHEFIADQKSAEQYGTSTLAAMILQCAYPEQFHKITNPFFHSSIKRRFAMLTNAQKTRISYVSRIAVLPLAVLIGFAFTVKPEKGQTGDFSKAIVASRQQVKAAANEQFINNVPPSRTENYRVSPVTDTTPRKAAGQKITVKENGKPSDKTIKVSNKQFFIVTDKDGKKETYQKASDSVVRVKGVRINGSESQPLIFVDGVEISKDEMEKISADTIQSVSVLKGEDATKAYGEKAKKGVILISLKKGSVTAK